MIDPFQVVGESSNTKLKRRSMATLIWSRLRKNKVAVIGGSFVLFLILCAIFAPLIAPYPYTQADFLATYQGPSWQHWFGTDELGRDMLSRLLYSLQTACVIGFGAELVEVTLGLFLGAIAGYAGGLVDAILMRIVDVVYGFPSLLFSIVLVVMLGHSVFAILIAVAATSWVGMARLVRGQVMVIKESDYISAARGLGATWWQILRRYVIPNSLGPVVVAITFGIPANMMVESALSLLGLGVEPPTPSWGALISNGQTSLFSFPYLLIFPTVTFALTLLSFTYLGDGLRNVFDSKSLR